jgi:TnpA family transposase
MPVIVETAYPRLSSTPTNAELETWFTPTPEDLAFADRHSRRSLPAPRIALLVLLKTFQRLGYFPRLAEVPIPILLRVARSTARAEIPEGLHAYDVPSHRKRLMARIRAFLDVSAFDAAARRIMIGACLEAARSRDDPADIANCAIEELVRQRRELPVLNTLLRAARKARATVNRGYQAAMYHTLDEAARSRLQTLLNLRPGETRTPWDTVKADAPRPSPQRMREFLDHLAWLHTQGADPAVFSGIPDLKLRQFALEAQALNAAVLNELAETKRLILIACFIRRQIARSLDDAAEMFIRQMQRMHNRARDALLRHQTQQVERTDTLIALLRDTVVACRSEGSKEERFDAVAALLAPDADSILAQCDAHAAVAGNNHLPFLLPLYRGQRAAFLRFLQGLPLVATSQDKAVEQAITFLLGNSASRNARLAVVRWERGADGVRQAVSLIDLSFVPDKWRELVTGSRRRDGVPTTVDRRYFELCLFSLIMQELRSGDLCMPGSEAHGDYREQLVPWTEYHQQIGAFGEQAGVPTDGPAFVARLKAELESAARQADDGFPNNEHLTIETGVPMLKRLRAKPDDEGLEGVHRLLRERLTPVGILDALADTEYWLQWTRHFAPLSGHGTKLERPRERYVTTAFCYGCNLGPTQTARSIRGLDRRQVAFVNQRHVTEETLDAAIATVINAYTGADLQKRWGLGRSASADGTQWEVYPQNLVSEYHVRYGGYGGIGYYLVADSYIALFSRFIACGAWEGNTILDFVTENRSDVQPDTIHADTQGQSAPIFGLAHLLGIQLMPRIRNWKELHLYRPDPAHRYGHIDALFTGQIDWTLIETMLPDMLRVAVSIRAGRMAPSAILNRLSTYSRKNRLYFAFRELGRVIRTVFLLRYLSDADLRRKIQGATNKSELFNKFAQWVFFGGGGIIAESVRDEQRKIIKYNHLIANLLIFHTLVGMTQVFDQAIQQEAVVPEAALAAISPYQTEHINRFGHYILDLNRSPNPLPFPIQTAVPQAV